MGTQPVNDIHYLGVYMYVYLFFSMSPVPFKANQGHSCSLLGSDWHLWPCGSLRGRWWNRGKGPAAPTHSYGYCPTHLTHPNTPHHTEQGKCPYAHLHRNVRTYWRMSNTTTERNPDTNNHIILLLHFTDTEQFYRTFRHSLLDMVWFLEFAKESHQQGGFYTGAEGWKHKNMRNRWN